MEPSLTITAWLADYFPSVYILRMYKTDYQDCAMPGANMECAAKYTLSEVLGKPYTLVYR